MITLNNGPMDPNWKPSVPPIDLLTATQRMFDVTYETFYQVNTDRVMLTDLFPTDGWYDITPQIAENLLLGRANRKLSVMTVAYYARLMKEGAWTPTGESLIVDKNGVMRDAYHRCWAAFLSGTSFVTYVVTGIEPDAATLMNIDNGRARSDADSLEFDGLNGLSKVISATVKIARKYDLGRFEPKSGVRVPRMSPPEVVAYVRAQTDLHDAIHNVIAEHKPVLTELLPGKTDVACFVGVRITELHGEDVADEFFTALGEEPDDLKGAIAQLQNKLATEVASQQRGYKAKLSKRDVLAYLIKTFNAWHTGRMPRGGSASIATDEAFPQFVQPVPPVAENEGASI